MVHIIMLYTPLTPTFSFVSSSLFPPPFQLSTGDRSRKRENHNINGCHIQQDEEEEDDDDDDDKGFGGFMAN